MLRKGWWLLALAVLALQGCKPYYVMDHQLSGLRSGLSTEQVHQQLDKKPWESFPVIGLQGEYLAEVYQVLTDQTQQTTVSCTQYGCIPVVYTEPVTEPFAFIYHQDQLVAWGFVDALRRHPSDEINRLGAAVATELQARGRL